MFYLDNIYQQRDIKKNKSSLPTSKSRSMTKESSTTKGLGFRTRKGFCLAETVNMGGELCEVVSFKKSWVRRGFRGSTFTLWIRL